MIVYVSIGNFDDKLSQERWSAFQDAVYGAVFMVPGSEVHGAWFSLPIAPFQNACWCVFLPDKEATDLKIRLENLAHHYEQDSIAWAEAKPTQFLKARK